MGNLALRNPRYLCTWGDESEALQWCITFQMYGIAAHVRGPVEPGRPASGYRVFIDDAADYDKAVEFKRGWTTVMKIRGDPSAFIDGIVAAANVRGKRIRKQIESAHGTLVQIAARDRAKGE